MMLTRQDDLEILKMLDLRDGEGLTCKQIAERFGVRRGSIIGKLHRVTSAEKPCYCRLPENKDGGMPRAWWK